MHYFEDVATVRDVLDLKLSEMSSHGGVLKVPADCTLNQLCTYLNDYHVGAVFVYDENAEIIGLVSERDVIHQIALYDEAALGMPILPMVSRNILACEPDQSLKQVAAFMAQKHIRHMAVRDVSGEYVGMISASDIENFAGNG